MDELTFRAAGYADLAIIHRLAHEIWWPTYEDYLTHDQISFMLEKIYSTTALAEQLKAGQRFSFAMRHDNPVGFVGFQPKSSTAHIMRIEKLYVLPAEQGKGTGKQLINHVAQIARAANDSCLELNVNRHNPARTFYERMGFIIVDTLDIPYHGYILNDFVLQKQL